MALCAVTMAPCDLYKDFVYTCCSCVLLKLFCDPSKGLNMTFTMTLNVLMLTLCGFHNDLMCFLQWFVVMQNLHVPSQWLCVIFFTLTLSGPHHDTVNPKNNSVWSSQCLCMTLTIQCVLSKWFFMTFSMIVCDSHNDSYFLTMTGCVFSQWVSQPGH